MDPDTLYPLEWFGGWDKAAWWGDMCEESRMTAKCVRIYGWPMPWQCIGPMPLPRYRTLSPPPVH